MGDVTLWLDTRAWRSVSALVGPRQTERVGGGGGRSRENPLRHAAEGTAKAHIHNINMIVAMSNTRSCGV